MKEYLLSTLENSKNYTLAVADAMPARGYDARVVENLWTFRELMNHIAYGIQWWGSNHVQGIKTDWAPPAAKGTKQQVLDYLRQAYEELKRTIERVPVSDSVVKGFQATIDHITHHRGQAVLHLRGQGITPPEYVY